MEFFDKYRQTKLKIKCHKKNKKQIVNRRNLKKNYFTYQYFFQNNFQNFPEIVGKISNPSNKNKTLQKIP